ETRNGNVVRFNGDFSGSEEDRKEFYHFDSWRTNVQPDLWLPTSFYVEESDPKSVSRTLKFKAINHIWGYVLKVPAKETENTTLSRPIRCRTLLTEPLESIAVGNTIIISKSLLDTTAVVTADGAQQMGNLNAILAFQIAHVILAHRLDTKYAFNDRLLFPTNA